MLRAGWMQQNVSCKDAGEGSLAVAVGRIGAPTRAEREMKGRVLQPVSSRTFDIAHPHWGGGVEVGGEAKNKESKEIKITTTAPFGGCVSKVEGTAEGRGMELKFHRKLNATGDPEDGSLKSSPLVVKAVGEEEEEDSALFVKEVVASRQSR